MSILCNSRRRSESKHRIEFSMERLEDRQLLSQVGNLLTNGDFSAGNTGFTSQYIYSPGSLLTEGTYTVDKNPFNDNKYGDSFGDHTTGKGLMLIANGYPKTNIAAWQETVNIKKNTNYSFSGWFASWGQPQDGSHVDQSPSNLRILIDGVKIGSDFTAIAQDGQWSQFSVTWNSGASDTAKIQIIDLNTARAGNDFVLDDLSFADSGPVQPSLALSAAPGGTYGATKLKDTVTLANGINPQGSITFNLYNNTGTKVDTESVAVNGNGKYTSPNGYTPIAVGVYQWVVTYSGDSNNNGVSTTYGTEPMTITPAPLTVTSHNATKVYGSNNPVFTGTVTGLVNGDSDTPTSSTTATAGSAVGNYVITPSLTDPNYKITYVPGKLTITPAPLTITADDKTKVYGAALPALTASYSGFVNGDTAASLTTRPTLSTTATAASRAGTYRITAAGAADSNFSITYVPGKLTITPAPLTTPPTTRRRPAAKPTLPSPGTPVV
jgi:MBG domain (YGX type)